MHPLSHYPQQEYEQRDDHDEDDEEDEEDMATEQSKRDGGGPRRLDVLGPVQIELLRLPCVQFNHIVKARGMPQEEIQALKRAR